MGDFADDELPLPSFLEVFGDGHPDMILVSNNAAAARRRLAHKRAGFRGGDESSGRWTPEEQKLFLEGLMLYGKDWKKMAPLIKTRTLVQIRTHAQKVFKKMGLKFVDKNKHVGMKRGLEDEDDIDEDRLNQLKQSGQLEGMIASGELNVGEADENERVRADSASATLGPHHVNAHLNPQVSEVRLPGVMPGTATDSVSSRQHEMAPSMDSAHSSNQETSQSSSQQPGVAHSMQSESMPVGASGIPQPTTFHQLQLMQQKQQDYIQQFLMSQQMQQQDGYTRQMPQQQQHAGSSLSQPPSSQPRRVVLS